MEVVSIIYIFDFCWVQFFLQSSEIIFAVLRLVFSCKCVLYWMLETNLVLTVDGPTGCSCEALSEQIFTSCLWDITSVSWYVLCLKVLSWSTDPVFTFNWIISILKFFVHLVLWWWVDVVIILLILRLADGNINIIFTWFLSCLINQSIDITSCATEHFVLFGHVTSVTWKVFFIVFDECLGSHF